MSSLEIFQKRLSKLNINLEYSINYPWFYLYRINGKYVTEKFFAEHGFTMALLPIDPKKPIKFINITELFKIIRKYINEDNQEKR